MLKEIFKGLAFLIKKPFLILISLIFLIVNSIMLFVLFDYWIELLLFFIIPPLDFSFELIPFYLIAMYPIELFAVFFMSLVSLTLFNWIFNSIAISLIEEKPSIKSSIEAFKNLPKHIGIALFYLIAGLLYFASFFLMLWIASQPGLNFFLILLILLIFVLTLIAFIVSYKLLFIPVALVFESNAKKAIQKSWNFTSKNFFNGLSLFLILFLFYYLLIQIGFNLTELIFDELIADILFLLINAIGLTYLLITLTEFFHEKNKKF
jgi:hypothetical protein